MLCAPALGQESAQSAGAPQPLITQRVDEAQLATLKGNTHPLARPEFDLGTAPASLPMERMLLVLKRSAEQEAALAKLLDNQQDKTSPNYHQWTTPEEFGKQFGPTDSDMLTVTAWLQSHGFQVGSTKGRTVLEFSGSASQVQEAFHTAIHKYVANGEQHWANASDPEIPAALAPAVAGVASLNNFPRKAMNKFVGTYSEKTRQITSAEPNFTYGCGNGYTCFGVTPYDFATIYNVLPLWNSGNDGTGQTIAIVGRTNINPQDPTTFWQLFGLTVPPNKLTITLNGPDPGINRDEAEADIDVQWSGAAAPQALINFVTSQSTETTDGVDLSAVYIVENNLAPVMSESYGECELGLGTAGNQFFSTLWQQAAAQGITVFISSGDNGSAGCDSPSNPAQYGLNVSGIASTPYNVAVGGTDFNQYQLWTTYWNSTNNATTQESAKGYIPEATWNDSCTNSLAITLGYGSTAEAACNNPQMLSAGGVNSTGGSGGASNCTVNTRGVLGTCTQGYAKPSWQTGAGVPNDRHRDLPDVSLFASNGFMGSSYLICQQDATYGTCNLNNFAAYGGTSVASPALAGIMALVNQKDGRQGNANYVFYKLAAKPSASCASSATETTSCIFNDVTSGTIGMPCLTGSPNCSTKTAGDQYGLLTGFNAGAGYDLATGLGSVNASNLVNQWSTVSSLPSVTALTNLTPTTITHGQAVNFTVTVKPQTGTGNPTGQISLIGGPSNSTQGTAGFTLANGTVSGSTEMLPGGSYSVTAHYPGDSAYGPSDSSPINVTVAKENSAPQVFLVTFDSNGKVLSITTTTAVYASRYLLRVNVENSAGQLCSPVSGSAATGCPSGNVTLTDNGSALDLGSYPLNSYGYVEDQLVQLTGGSHSVKAAYAGDSSFNPSSVTNTITITPASTTMSQPYVYGAQVGQSAQISVYVNTTSSGAAPSGPVTFYANGTAIGGTTTYSPRSGGIGYSAYLQANLTTDNNAFPAAGSYAITATYNADANYSTSTSAATNITVMYPAPLIAPTPANQTLTYGATATITALVDTTNKSTYPTGTITFTDPSGAAIGPITCTSVKDASGNFACHAVGSFTVTTSGSVLVKYSGDVNYPSTQNWAYVNMPDFQLSQGGVQLTAGQSQTMTVTIQSMSGFTGTVSNFTCSDLPAETTCTFSPAQLTLDSNGSGSTTLTVTTTAIGQSSKQTGTRKQRAKNWGAGEALLLVGVCWIGIPLLRRKGRIPVALALTLLFVVLPSCGGGGGSGGGGGGTKNPVPSISSLSPTQVAAGSQVQNLYINGSSFMSSSTVTYNGVLHNSSLQSPTQLQIALSPNDIATTGQFPLVVTNPSPGGGASAPMNFAVLTGTPTGTFYATLTASSGPITHNVTLFILVQ